MEKTHLVSTNLKTTWSVNFPIAETCQPTSVCNKYCYAKSGRLSMQKSLVRQKKVYEIFKNTDPERVAAAITDGCIKRGLTFLRWAGSGDMSEYAVNVLNFVAEHTSNTVHWVVTRIPSMVKLIKPVRNVCVGFSLDGCMMSKERKKEVDAINHPRQYYSYLRQFPEEDVGDARIIYNLKQKKNQLPYKDIRVCPVDAGRLKVIDACKKCRKCFSDKCLKLK